jgi:hypothetical protein
MLTLFATLPFMVLIAIGVAGRRLIATSRLSLSDD